MIAIAQYSHVDRAQFERTTGAQFQVSKMKEMTTKAGQHVST
jgi:hypothetical protein